jgi:pimeloyl-ACP methyl ester carboxylesterase/DNA-binding CsgD family transcriptional regulator
MDAPPVQYATTSDGYDIAFTDTGDGPPLVFMPVPFNHVQLHWRQPGMFHFLYSELASRYRLICYDSRAMGSSSRGLAADHRSQDFELDLDAIVDKLRLERFALLAPLNFGRIAMSYAVHHPQRLQGLILWNPDIGSGTPLDTTFKPDQLDELARVNWDLFVETNAYSSPIHDAAHVQNFARESISQADWLRRIQAWRSYSVADILEDIRVPSLVIATSAGAWPFSTEQASRQIAARISGARLVLFDDLGGGLFSRGPETPAGVLLIEEFVKGLATAVKTAGEATQARLSTRELEVLSLVAAGKSSREIGGELVLSVRTVERHIANIYLKTETHGRAQLATYALQHGLL